MQVKTYRKIKAGLMGFLLVLVGWSVWRGSGLPAFVGLITYLMGVSWLKLRVTGVLADERQIQTGEKAAQISFRILLPMLGLTSLALYMGGGEAEFYYVKALGIVLSYVTSVGLVVYTLAYWYFDRKSGGQ